MIIVLAILNGYRFFGRPKAEELRMDLRAVLMKCRWDWDLSDPAVRAAWQRGETHRFYAPELGWPPEVAARDTGTR